MSSTIAPLRSSDWDALTTALNLMNIGTHRYNPPRDLVMLVTAVVEEHLEAFVACSPLAYAEALIVLRFLEQSGAQLSAPKTWWRKKISLARRFCGEVSGPEFLAANAYAHIFGIEIDADRYVAELENLAIAHPLWLSRHTGTERQVRDLIAVVTALRCGPHVRCEPVSAIVPLARNVLFADAVAAGRREDMLLLAALPDDIAGKLIGAIPLTVREPENQYEQLLMSCVSQELGV